MVSFRVPVVLFLFRRSETLPRIVSVLRDARVEKLYLICDQGRNETEREQVGVVRRLIEKEIDWDCEVVKYYAEENRGVLRNIGDGARWVFQREEQAIFLEDDNLPEATFFPFCEEMLHRYKDDDRILWVCGSNYLGDAEALGYNHSYFFSQMLLPCGWASWAKKFNEFYDDRLAGLDDSAKVIDFRNSYDDNRLFAQENRSVLRTKSRIENDIARASWDYQMVFSLRVNHMYGVVPSKNQIRNIGVDAISEHGGNTMKNVMTERFCENETLPLSFPLSHPSGLSVPFEDSLTSIILAPLHYRVRGSIGALLKKALRMNEGESFLLQLKKRLGMDR
ncbi:glycosyltransferase family 2 protein [Parvibacter caecicola]|uniref:Glycosyltransferase family 2 protein n=1 Tax=Parvibacter caecicola TaxID=747645 RepID=A0A4T9T8H7_9ACTN|nr:glycosyltransferase family 2 protein [Parvibacter caecicola]TJW11358.1 glycosyltransferase family 2 protein [Parvibacter caecicola]